MWQIHFLKCTSHQRKCDWRTSSCWEYTWWQTQVCLCLLGKCSYSFQKGWALANYVVLLFYIFQGWCFEMSNVLSPYLMFSDLLWFRCGYIHMGDPNNYNSSLHCNTAFGYWNQDLGKLHLCHLYMPLLVYILRSFYWVSFIGSPNRGESWCWTLQFPDSALLRYIMT